MTMARGFISYQANNYTRLSYRMRSGTRCFASRESINHGQENDEISFVIFFLFSLSGRAEVFFSFLRAEKFLVDKSPNEYN